MVVAQNGGRSVSGAPSVCCLAEIHPLKHNTSWGGGAWDRGSLLWLVGTVRVVERAQASPASRDLGQGKTVASVATCDQDSRPSHSVLPSKPARHAWRGGPGGCKARFLVHGAFIA